MPSPWEERKGQRAVLASRTQRGVTARGGAMQRRGLANSTPTSCPIVKAFFTAATPSGAAATGPRPCGRPRDPPAGAKRQKS